MPCRALFRSNVVAWLAAAALSAAELLAGPSALGQKSSIDSAFAAVRRGRALPEDFKVKPADIPAVARFLDDRNTSVRTAAIIQLITLGEPACAALRRALVDSAGDLRERAARGMHRVCPESATARIAGLDADLRRSIDMGNTAAGALLLLGRFDNEATKSYFERRIASADGAAIKLNPWNPPVQQRLGAAVGGVSAAVPDAEAVVERGLGPIEEAEFIALALVDIRPAAKLLPLLSLLDDQRTVDSGTPSGATPKRRIRDLALDTLVQRLSLQPSFQLRLADRYTDAEIAQVRELAAAAISKG